MPLRDYVHTSRRRQEDRLEDERAAGRELAEPNLVFPLTARGLDVVDEGVAQRAVLELQQGHGNASTSRAASAATLARFKKKAPGAAESVGAEAGSVTFMPGTTGDEQSTLFAGEKGFTVQMLKAVPVGAGKAFGYYKDAHLKNVHPNLAPIDKRLREAAEKQREAEDELDTILPTIPSHYRIWGERKATWEKRAHNLAANRAKESMLCQDFNAGVPRANQVFISLAKLEAMQEILGVGSPTAMSQAVVSSLKEAEMIAEKVQVKGGAGDLDVPAADEQVTSATKDLTIAQKKMGTAWIGVQRLLVLDRAAEVNAEGDDERKRLKEINDTIATVKRIGTTIDLSMAVMGVGITGATEGGGLIGAIEGKGAKSFAKDTITGEITATGGGVPKGLTETKAAIEKASGISIPTSAGDILETAAKIYYAGEVEQIRKTLATLENEVAAHKKVADELGVSQALKAFKDATDEFAKKSEDLQKRVLARQQAYLKFGQQLDEAAVKDPKFAGSAPGKGKERFATVMVVTSAVREVLAMAEGAKAGFPWDSVGLSLELAAMADAAGITEEEGKPLVSMHSQLSTFEGNVKALTTDLGPIEAAGKSMMTKLGAGQELAGAY